MDESKKPGRSSVNVEFLRSESASRQAKVEAFWKYLESQADLQPYEVPKIVVAKDKVDESSTADNSSSDASSVSAKSTGAKPKQKIQKERKRSNGDVSKVEKYFREDLRFADSVEASYDELNAEIEDYQKRLLRCGCKNDKCDCQQTKSKRVIVQLK